MEKITSSKSIALQKKALEDLINIIKDYVYLNENNGTIDVSYDNIPIVYDLVQKFSNNLIDEENTLNILIDLFPGLYNKKYEFCMEFIHDKDLQPVIKYKHFKYSDMIKDKIKEQPARRSVEQPYFMDITEEEKLISERLDQMIMFSKLCKEKGIRGKSLKELASMKPCNLDWRTFYEQETEKEIIKEET